MIFLSLILIIILLISLTLYIINLIFSKKILFNKNKITPFECGFSPISSSRLPFSLQFYFISLLFLIFDVETILLIPIIKNFQIYKLYYWIFNTLFFMFILLVGLLIEIYENTLKWLK
uniref:NADH-ubiquinone oxidoreductase chain 3 n=2 Tax=Pelecinus polyturator TaxID=44352 RepID=A0A0E3EKS7_9HYME|nr:NADH dehydrogenase subunit 3 [Pelecinus polyturator]AIW82478.1 NADH dehydrogenase subunit 3 [Pelecinus polyturator]